MKAIAKRVNFLLKVVRDRKIGAVTMSSHYVIADVLRQLPKHPRLIVEYGPGEGAITRAMLPVLAEDARLFAVEPNLDFVSELKKIEDSRLIIIPNMAQSLTENELRNMQGADAVVASMPFSFSTPLERERVVADAFKLLAPGGHFIISHQYSWLMKEYLEKKFIHVSLSFEARNLFPCFVLHAVKPI